MNRRVSQSLDAWLASARRLPLVLRGARQVGKTWLVRDLARRAGRELVEINFERDPTLARYFAPANPREVVAGLSLWRGRAIDAERTLLFLDEVQAAGQVLAALRWFAEELPALPVIAAGSLLELVLADHAFSMPVGRIGYRHVDPLGFAEVLDAHGQQALVDAIAAWHPGRVYSDAAHDSGLVWWHRHAMVGGMPAVVRADAEGATPGSVRDLQRDLTATFRDDFAKYRARVSRETLEATLRHAAVAIGSKLVYAHVGEGLKQAEVKRSFALLDAARVCHLVHHTHATGVPLAGDANPRFRKAILGDVGLLHALLDTPASDPWAPAWTTLSPAVRGRLAEQLAGQELRLLGDDTGDGPRLHYWQRGGGRPGEVDYVAQLEGRVIPIELKSGAAGAMKSLHQLLYDRQLDLAIRVDENPPSLAEVDVATTQGDRVRYRLLSVPFPMMWRLRELVRGL